MCKCLMQGFDAEVYEQSKAVVTNEGDKVEEPIQPMVRSPIVACKEEGPAIGALLKDIHAPRHI